MQSRVSTAMTVMNNPHLRHSSYLPQIMSVNITEYICMVFGLFNFSDIDFQMLIDGVAMKHDFLNSLCAGIHMGYLRRAHDIVVPFRVDLAHLVLYHLSLCCKRKYFDFDHEILSFTNENWESLLLGEVGEAKPFFM